MSDMNLNSTEWMYVVTPQDATWSLFDEYPDRGARVRERVLEKYRRWHRLIQAVEEYAHDELLEDLRRIKFRELDEDHFNKLLQHYFLSPTAIAKGNIHLVLEDTDNQEHREQLRRAIGAINRIEAIVHNMVETGEIKEK